eukprot:gnl/TRDRNA2_/TRDRNA2_90269_c0_seq1.p1 gnl/TRDRNA2_/TRDRNA2_90269_c0~~gnl/TRDRNA2_/TRDRNA2_90269_c0_seq1.p1  ORF type:complete len:244 (-),score=69.30 gnl/TRDRNA2_/TRDRNA2_90269_c0_seq1:33-764(-)
MQLAGQQASELEQRAAWQQERYQRLQSERREHEEDCRRRAQTQREYLAARSEQVRQLALQRANEVAACKQNLKKQLACRISVPLLGSGVCSLGLLIHHISWMAASPFCCGVLLCIVPIIEALKAWRAAVEREERGREADERARVEELAAAARQRREREDRDEQVRREAEAELRALKEALDETCRRICESKQEEERAGERAREARRRASAVEEEGLTLESAKVFGTEAAGMLWSNLRNRMRKLD